MNATTRKNTTGMSRGGGVTPYGRWAQMCHSSLQVPEHALALLMGQYVLVIVLGGGQFGINWPEG